MRKRRIVTGAMVSFLALLLMAIWMFSAQDATASDALSNRVANFFFWHIPWLSRFFMASDFAPFVRKLAHFILYLIFGVITTAILRTWNKRLSLGWILVAGFIFAGIDELHQRFTPGRHGCLDDVLIDEGGVCAGIVLLLVVNFIYHTFSRKTQP